MKSDAIYGRVYRILLGGMYASTAAFSAGLILALARPRFVPLDPEWVKSHYSWRAVAEGLTSGDPAAYMLLGTVALILTPIARVASSVLVFLAEGDRKYAAITSAVLAIMALSLLLARFGLHVH